MAAHGGYTSLVPTTSIYTATDEIVQPFTSGELHGPHAVNIELQKICPGRVQGHFGLVVDSISEYFTLQAFRAGSTANPSALTAEKRAELCQAKLPGFTSIHALVNFTLDMMISVIKTVVTGGGLINQSTAEPPLMSYAI